MKKTLTTWQKLYHASFIIAFCLIVYSFFSTRPWTGYLDWTIYWLPPPESAPGKSKHIGKPVCRGSHDYPTKKLNCWKSVKFAPPQRNDETGINVKATKVEKSGQNRIWLNPKYETIANQQLNSEQEKVQRLSLLRGVGYKPPVSEAVSPKS